jgi:hypothetical protein
MKRLQTFPGGQPTRPNDFKMVQDESLTMALEMIRGLCDGAAVCIVSGLKLTNTGGTSYTISPGYFFDGIELCYTSGINFILDEARVIYLVKHEVEESSRQFLDLSYHKVVKNREYTIVYDTVQPANSFRYDSLERLVNLLSINPNPIDFRLGIVASQALGIGYHGTGIYDRVHVLANPYGDVTILAQFTAEYADGNICTISTATISVPSPVYGQYWNGTAWKRFIWHTNGDLEVLGAGLSSAVNIIQFQVNINVAWPQV